jgi:flagellar biosynthesis/type III secretory pathway M-ring protein FliF/YscJ
MKHQGDHQISSDAAREILARAADLDTERDGTLNLADLRSAAVEAGISEESFDRALQRDEEPSGTRWQQVSRWLAFLILLAVTLSMFLTIARNRPTESAPTVVVPEQTR